MSKDTIKGEREGIRLDEDCKLSILDISLGLILFYIFIS